MNERFDLYANIHKALRNHMGAVLLQLGRLDIYDELDVERTSGALLGLLDWLEMHLAIEERFVHGALSQRGHFSLVPLLHRDHEEHQRSFVVLRLDAEALAKTMSEPAEARRARARQLYLATSRFFAENFLHMAVEETEMNLVLWETFTDAELIGIYQNILANESPEHVEHTLGWLLPAVSPEERAKIIGGARALMPAAVFTQLLPVVRRALGDRDYEKLAGSLGLDAAA